MMTPEMKKKWQTVSTTLLLLHKKFMEWQFSETEKARGPINNPNTRLQLLLSDSEFQWFRWMSQLVTQIDHVMDSRDPISAEAWSLNQSQWVEAFKSNTGVEFQDKLKLIGQNNPELNKLYSALVEILIPTQH
ncbi:MAG: hypothetical protein K2Q26_12900 [Bdellovibrionales bacterium]|nr:hypothetical protein [Bdellovibrionales bacterium]